MNELGNERFSTEEFAISQPRSIADRAYELWLQRGCPSGTDLKDWLDAERELDRASVFDEDEKSLGEKSGERDGPAAERTGRHGLSAEKPHLLDSDWELVTSAVEIDETGVIIDVSESTAEMFRLLPYQMRGQLLAEMIVSPAERATFQRNLVQYISVRTNSWPGVRYQCFAMRADGSKLPIELMFGRGVPAEPPRFMVSIRDLTSQTLSTLRAAHFADLVQFSDDSIVGTMIDGTVTSWNRGAERLYGYSAQEMIGRNISRVFPPGRADELALILQKIQRGESIELGDAVRRRKDGRLIDVFLTISPIRDRSGGVIGISAVGRDISDRKAIERSRAAEHAVVRVLAESDSFDDARDRILRTIGERLNWSFGAVWEEDPEFKVLRCVSTWCSPNAPPYLFERHSQQLMLPRGVGLPGRVWESGGPNWISYPGSDGNFPRRETALAEQLHSGFAFPVVTRRSFYCVFEFLCHERREPDATLLEMMTHIGSQIAQFVERRKSDEALHGRQREMEVAREIQQRLLPKFSPKLDGFEIAAATHPAQETGGDLFDFLPLATDLLGVVIGDASGHGIGAALVIAETRAYLRAFAAGESDPSRLLAETNRCLVGDLGSEFVTLFLGRLDPATQSLTYASAGHWPGYVISREGVIKAQLPSTGIPLGLQLGEEFPTSPVIRMVEGDLLLLLTDGIVEATSPEGELFGIDRVLDLVRSHLNAAPYIILGELSLALREFTGGRFVDDRTAVVIKATAV